MSHASAKNEHIIVIGAGIAGLSAAQKLQQSGYQVTVLEARDRIGGRIWTERSLGVPMDMGASWIHGITNNPVAAIAAQADIPLSPAFDYEDAIFYDHRGQVDVLPDEYVERFTSLMEDQVYRSPLRRQQASVAALIDQKRDKGKLDFLTQRQLNHLSNTVIEHEFGADINELSIAALYEGEEQEGEDVLFPKGYDAIINYLARDLDILTNTPVSGIHYNGEGVNVFTQDNAQYVGDRLIVTVPLGVLQAGSIHFSPPLPADKQSAIASLKMGVLNKLWLRFPLIFWDKDVSVIEYMGEQHGHFAEWVNAYIYLKQPVLLGFNAGSYGTEIEQKTDQAIVLEAMNILRDMYGNNIPEPEGYLISRWHSDPYSRGAYSYTPAGTSPKARKVLAKPIANRVFFAGEASHSGFPSTTHGALLSGLRAAELIEAQ